MDTIVKTRFYIWLEENHILDHMQAAYRQDENITQAMLSFVLRAFKGFSKGETTIAVSIDLEGAFDAVWRDAVTFKLHESGMGGRMLLYFDSYLNGRTSKNIVSGFIGN